MPDKRHFYIIPEYVLIEIGAISTPEITAVDNINVYPYDDIEYLLEKGFITASLNAFLFDYDDPDWEWIRELFDLAE